ncbi:zinc finger CCCH domain-containing protein 3 isoform X3 [Cricetulus griseus]|nr:zinc finger CCCH domain-containing protein 3 isoform X3 [Cricetulus griseus]XP_007649260.1 zinc finger CCCH domain-containing protein 3 isoform X3 [Cricetulus griseus]XP_007649263.1 zinc finger CCCH domain-containing protein 3 isoform X3 [Cricetulus griseus]XP_016835162.1 zinc finger CCCH domain-containing protein 3 isoform X3 [Cricetulus griseus]XP_027259649.1 zinc finger CCCH domain-containing protein 3 isoform X3 [Cricetulus griseus]XP_027259650.1 zinc finger CCCH domain-containing prote
MTSRGPGWASRTREMEEKEQLRRQIRLLQGLIDDYKTLHGNGPALGTSATRWQPSTYQGGRTFGARYSRPNRRGFSSHHGPLWRKKYSLVNQPLESSDPASDHALQASLRSGDSHHPDPQQYVLERQVQLSPDQNMVIKIKPPSKTGSTSASGIQRGSLEDESSWNDQRPQGSEVELPGGQPQPARPGRTKVGYSVDDPLLVCQKEPGKPRVVKSVGRVSDNPSEHRRTVSESEIAVKAHFPSSIMPQRTGMALGRKVGPHSASYAEQLIGDHRAYTGHADQPASLGSVVAPVRPATGTRQVREGSLLVSCRTNKFRKNNYKWVAASEKSPRVTRRALSPRTTMESVNKAAFGTVGKTEKPQPKVDPEARPEKQATSFKLGPSPSKYKWKASSPSASSSSSFRWQSEAGSKDHTSQLSPVPSRSPSGDRPAVGSSNLKPLFGEPPLSTYKVKSRTKIIRRRGSTSLPTDKKSSPTTTTTNKNHLTQRRRQALRGKTSPVLRKTPHKGLMQVTRHRLSCMPSSRAHLSTKEGTTERRTLASNVHLRTPPSNKVIKTRYRIVKKTPTSPLNAPSFPSSLPSWRARRISLSRSLVLNRLRPTVTGGGKAPPGSPQWRNKGYRCIGGVLYKVSANKLSKTCSRPSDSNRVLLRTGRLDPATSSRSLASRAVQRSLAIIRQAKQKKEKKREYCMYYNRFGRCNRGERCPYIHDPEKVAVCTRFVRGTCKKTDGSCPFSHHVSKEKMPVCSYFLKGICSNSNCPYSHVYVSRKAEVCSDFLKGYCPLGAKCKKKHTLLCPDFARRGICPRGAQCQLLHRNQKRHGRRTAAPTATPGPSDGAPKSRASAGHVLRKLSTVQRPARQMSSGLASRTEAPTSPPPSPRVLTSTSTLSSKATAASSPSSSCSASSPTPSLDQEEATSGTGGTGSGTGSSSLCKLPSFISLHSSPSPGGQSGSQTPRSPRTKDSGKPLHIKPRL